MLGLLLLVCIFAILGFMYAWITGIVAGDEISVGTGVLVVLFPLIGLIALGAAGIDNWAIGSATNFGLLIVGGKFIAKVEWKPAAIIATVYTALMFLVSLGLGAMAG